MMTPEQQETFAQFNEEEKLLWAKLHAAHTEIVKLLMEIGTLDFRTPLDQRIYQFSYPLDLAARNTQFYQGDYLVFTATLDTSEPEVH